MPTTTSPPVLIWQPSGGTPIGSVSNPPVYSQAGITPLINGQNYVDVVFGSTQTTPDWVLVECEVVNTTDVAPLNIWPGIMTSKLTTGFRLYLNGMPDSGNYYLHWAVSGVNIPPPVPHPATSYTLTGPTSGVISVPSTAFTVALPAGGTVSSPVTVTPSDGGAGGVFTPMTVTLTTGSPSSTFTYTPSTYLGREINVTNDGSLTDPFGITYDSLASTYTLSGPSSGPVSVPSTNFTVALPVGGDVIGSVTVTPSDGGAGGTFAPTTMNLSSGGPSATFTYTPSSGGAKTISTTNNGGLTDPGSLTYTASVPAAGHYRSLTVDHTKVSGNQTDFPVLVNVTDATLKTIANGGHVQRSDGFDIGFYSDSGRTIKLKWEIDRYNPATGEVVAWVKIAALSSTVDTVFYIGYGDPAITTDQSDKVNVWSNGFVAVYHLGNGTTLNVLDSKGAFNGTISGSPTAAAGQIDGCIYTGGGGAHVAAGAPVTTAPATISCWAQPVGIGTFVSILAGAGGWNGFYMEIAASGAFKGTTVSNNFAVFGQATYTVASTAIWHLYATVIPSASSRTCVVDGVAGTTDTTAVTPTASPTDLTIAGVLVSGTYSSLLDSLIDEVRVANVARTTGWLLTEYNNQGTPGTFITVGTEL